MSKKPGILFDNRLFRHAIDRQSPENPERLRRLHQRLDTASYRHRFERIPLLAADTADVEAVHSRFYLDQIRSYSRSPDPFSYDKDTYVMSDSLDCAFMAAGASSDFSNSFLPMLFAKLKSPIIPPCSIRDAILTS